MSDVVVRAPGRVNLIGEHTDYMHLPVLPMAIQRGITIEARATSAPGLVATSASHTTSVDIALDGAVPETWGRYLFGVLRQLGDTVRSRGAELSIDSDLPDTGGLSSSSALTTGAMKALALLWNLDIDDAEIASRAIAAERIVGVESGGMDQTVIMFAESGSALRIDWMPPRRRAVPIPSGLRFVIGYSGTPAPKGGSARDLYNERVVACRAAAALLQQATGIPAGSPPVLAPFAEMDLDELTVPAESTAQEVAAITGLALDEFVALTAGRFDSERPLPVAAAAHHVLSEARRVDFAEVAIDQGDLHGLGRLFDESHTSLRSYGVSTPGLDAVVEAAAAAGAAGARLTGAGFGGWAVAVCDPGRVDQVVEAMSRTGGGLAFEVVAAGGIH